MNAIKIRDLSFKYEDNLIFENLNLEFDYNKLYLITSKTGLGKSTLLNLLNGTIKNYNCLNYDGFIKINDIDIKDKDISFISNYVSSVFQNPDHQIIENTVEDEIAFGLENNNIKSSIIHEKINEITKLLKIDKTQDPNFLSGGQKQKLVIASNIVLMRNILLLDEPLAYLDNKSSIQLFDLLKELKDKYKLCIIVAEHKIDQIYKYFDFIYEIKNKNLELIKKIDIQKRIEQFNSLDFKQKVNDKIYKKENILFSIKDLNYKIKDKIILNNINIDIYDGEKLLIIGENGQGKTTLLEILSKLIKTSRKNYFIKKLSQYRKSKRWFNVFGQIFQNPNYQLFNKTVLEEIYFQNKKDENIENLIDRLNLRSLLNKHPFSLSEGEKRRVAICSILAKKPNVCLFDEPSVGQDLENLKNIYDIIKDINNKNKTTFIIVSHDINFLHYEFDRIIWIKNNTIYKIGNKELIYSYLKGE